MRAKRDEDRAQRPSVRDTDRDDVHSSDRISLPSRTTRETKREKGAKRAPEGYL
jgi:hypothetical protein